MSKITLKQALKEGKIEQFAEEHGDDVEADETQFDRVLTSMVQKPKAVPAASVRDSDGG